MVSPAYFTLKADGSIVSTEESDTNAFLRAQKVKILPLVKNEAHNAAFTPIGTPFKAIGDRWIGAKVGLIATGKPDSKKAGYADFNWFHVTPPAR